MNKFNSLAIIALSCLVLSCKKEKIYNTVQAPTPTVAYDTYLQANTEYLVNSNSAVDTVLYLQGEFSADGADYSPDHFSCSGINMELDANKASLNQPGHLLSLFNAPLWFVSCNELGGFSYLDTALAPVFPAGSTASFPTVSRTHALTISLAGAQHYDNLFFTVYYSDPGAYNVKTASIQANSGSTSATIPAQDISQANFSLGSSVLVYIELVKTIKKNFNGHEISFSKRTSYVYKSTITN